MDRTTELLSSYACNLTYEDLPPEVVHQVKRTVADTLGCAVGGYLSEPAKVARKLAGDVTSKTSARILGTYDRSSLDMAGFANGVMVRYLDCNDSYFSPGGGHPSDMIPAALAVGDSVEADGRTIITAIALAYEAFCRIADHVPDNQWDQGVLSVIGAACAAGKILGLDEEADGPCDFAGGGAQRAPARDPDGRVVDVEGMRRRGRDAGRHLRGAAGGRGHDGTL